MTLGRPSVDRQVYGVGIDFRSPKPHIEMAHCHEVSLLARQFLPIAFFLRTPDDWPCGSGGEDLAAEEFYYTTGEEVTRRRSNSRRDEALRQVQAMS